MHRHIAAIRIQGFQSHADSLINLTPGLNAITGPSDSGKSAILRALAWVLWNTAPSGEFVRRGCNTASVTITMSDGTSITRERRGKRNSYTVALPGAEPMVFADFGLKVPAEVLKAHGMTPVAFDPDRPSILNWASQLEPPFFLTEPAPQRARILGRLAGVHVIDAAIRGANRDTQAIARENTQREAEAARLDTQLTAYTGLDEQAVRVAQAEAHLVTLEGIESRLERLRALSARFHEMRIAWAATTLTLTKLACIDDAQNALSEAQGTADRAGVLRRTRDILEGVTAEQTGLAARLQRLARVPDALIALNRAEGAEHDRTWFARLRTTYQGVDAQITATTAILHRTAGAQAAALALDRLGDTQGRLTALQGHRARLTDTQGRLARGAEVITGLTSQIRTTGDAYAKALQEAGVCPTCLQTVDPETAARIATTMTEEVCANGHAH